MRKSEQASCRGGIVAVCLLSAGNELVKEKSKWFIGRKGGNRGREDSEKERKRLSVIGESLCLFVFSLFFVSYYFSPVFPSCPFVKHSTPPTHTHIHICQLLLSSPYIHCVKLHWLFQSLFLSSFCSLTLLWSTSVTSLCASLSSACHLSLRQSFYGSNEIFHSYFQQSFLRPVSTQVLGLEQKKCKLVR